MMTRASVAALVVAVLSLSTLACQPPLPADVGVGVEYEGLSVCPGKSTLTGVDVSTYQGTVDWAKVKASGRAFAITRVGDGLGGDNTFDANWAGIKARGHGARRVSVLPRQRRSEAAGRRPAGRRSARPPTAICRRRSISRRSTGSRRRRSSPTSRRGSSYVKMKTGRTPMIYTSPGFWPSIGNPDLSAYVLWVAHWGTTCPTMPTGWTTWAFHQDADNGTVSGISGAVDTDVFDGDQAALNAIASNGTTAGGDWRRAGGSRRAPAAESDGGTDGLGSGGGGTGGVGGGGGAGNGDTGGGGKGDAPGMTMAQGC